MQIRNYTNADFNDYLQLGNKLDIHGQVMTEEDLRMSLTMPKTEPEMDILMVTDKVKLIGYARVRRNRDMKVNRHNFGISLPEALYSDNALFDDLLSRCETRIRKIALEYDDMPLSMKSGCYDEEEKRAAALERNGYEIVRYFARMDLNDISELPKPELRDDVTIRLFNREKETPAFLDAFNLGFQGHYEHYDETPEMFEIYLNSHWFQPENVFVAEHNNELIGICWNYLNEERERDGVLWGSVSDLAIIPDWRGKGLGRALIRQGHLTLRENGAEKICLWVDYANPFNAKKLYYSEGYVDRYISRSYEKKE